MSNIKKLMMSAAGGAGLDVDEVFSTYLYTGNGSSQTITNDIDLDGEGGMVWVKNRDSNTIGGIGDTERGTYSLLAPSERFAPLTGTTANFTAFNSDGFGVGTGNYTLVNYSGHNYASWTFRKAPKFFDIVTYTGNGTNGRTISHNLGSAPGCIIVKDTSYNSDWKVYHRGIGETKWLELNNTTSARTGNENWYDTAPTSSVFTVGSQANNNGSNFVAYLFAHNDGDGEFGPNGDADIIKCGSYTSDGSGLATVDVGFEPQWVLYKASTAATHWSIADSMRGFVADTASASGKYLNANSTSAELSNAPVGLTNTGFKYNSAPNIGFIYIAIRRGTKVPESGDEVFAMDTAGGTAPTPPIFNSGFPVDMVFWTITNGYSKEVQTRLLGKKKLLFDSSFAETNGSEGFDFMNGWWDASFTASNYPGYMWKRAPNFFDVVAYEWNGVGTRDVEHSLGVAPEMYIVKRRNSTTSWYVRHKDFFGTNGSIVLNSTAAKANTGLFTTAATTDTTFPVANDGSVNASGGTYIAYLFATLAGVSKVGSYTGNGSSQTIDCGFSSGARFILVKRTDSTGDWYFWDTERGIVAGNDPYLVLNSTQAQVTSTDWVDPDNSGFIVNGTTINASSAEYIFYAIA